LFSASFLQRFQTDHARSILPSRLVSRERQHLAFLTQQRLSNASCRSPLHVLGTLSVTEDHCRRFPAKNDLHILARYSTPGGMSRGGMPEAVERQLFTRAAPIIQFQVADNGAECVRNHLPWRAFGAGKHVFTETPRAAFLDKRQQFGSKERLPRFAVLCGRKRDALAG